MATGKSGTIVITNTASSGLAMGSCRFTWTEEYDISSNTSVVSITKMEMLCAGDGYGNRNYGLGNLWFRGAISINSVGVLSVEPSSAFIVVPQYGAYTDARISHPPLPWSTTVLHDSDGSKNVVIEVDMFANSMSGDARANTTIKGSTTISLTTIPRASTVTAGDSLIGSEMAITVNRASASFTHTITYAFGSASGTLASGATDTTIRWIPDLSLCAQIPASVRGDCTLTCYTYSNGVLIGTTTSSFALIVPDSVKPSASTGWAIVSYDNSGTAAASITEFVQNYSRAKVTFDGAKINTPYSSVAGYYIMFNGVKFDANNSVSLTGVLVNPGTLTLTAVVRDQRGRTFSDNLNFVVQPYSTPVVVNGTVFRSDSSGQPSESGTFYAVKAVASYSSLNGKNSYTMEASHGAGTYALVSDVLKIVDGISSAVTYTVTITLTDALGNKSVFSVVIPTAVVAMNLRKTNDGVAFGKYSEHPKTLELPDGWMIEVGEHGVLHNKNLLDNPWFTVNQRGQTTYSGEVYTVDRWVATWTGEGTTEVLPSGGIRIYRPWYNAHIRQILDTDILNLIRGQVVTISVLAENGNVGFDIAGDEFSFTTGGTGLVSATFQIPDNITWCHFHINNETGYPVDIKAAKLELGSVSTLANDVPPDYATELYKCRRFYRKYDKAYYVYASGSGNDTIYAPMDEFNPPMRIVPSITWSSRVYDVMDNLQTTVVYQVYAASTDRLPCFRHATMPNVIYVQNVEASADL